MELSESSPYNTQVIVSINTIGNHKF